MQALVDELAGTRIGRTYNQYADGPRAALLRTRLLAYLCSRAEAPILLVGEAPGYRGARVSGIPFTSERQLTGSGPAEATATIVHHVLRELGLDDRVLLWNVVPTHPGTAARIAPPRAERSTTAASSRASSQRGVASWRSAVSRSGRLRRRTCAIPRTAVRMRSGWPWNAWPCRRRPDVRNQAS